MLDATDGKGLNLTVDMLSGPTVSQTMACTALLGRIVSIGRRVNPQAEADNNEASGTRVISVAVSTETRDDGTEVLDAQANRLLQAAAFQPGSRKSGIEALVLYPAKN